jgi:hypothetical protein
MSSPYFTPPLVIATDVNAVAFTIVGPGQLWGHTRTTSWGAVQVARMEAKKLHVDSDGACASRCVWTMWFRRAPNLASSKRVVGFEPTVLPLPIKNKTVVMRRHGLVNLRVTMTGCYCAVTRQPGHPGGFSRWGRKRAEIKRCRLNHLGRKRQ